MTNPQDNFIQEKCAEFEEKFLGDYPTGGDGGEREFCLNVSSDAEEAIEELSSFLEQALEAQKSHIKETLLAGMAGERTHECHEAPETWCANQAEVDGYNTARKEDRALINNI